MRQACGVDGAWPLGARRPSVLVNGCPSPSSGELSGCAAFAASLATASVVVRMGWPAGVRQAVGAGGRSTAPAGDR
jgi:hypothetical protein